MSPKHATGEGEANIIVDDVKTDVSIFVVPTKGVVDDEKTSEKVMIDTEHLSSEDLKKLRKQDPFLYYSIPAVRNAVVRHREVDMSVLRNNSGSTSQSSQDDSPSDTNRQALSLSCSSSSSVQVDSEPSSSMMMKTTTKVERKSCISFECSPDLILEGSLDEMALGDDGNYHDVHLDLDSTIHDQLVYRRFTRGASLKKKARYCVKKWRQR